MNIIILVKQNYDKIQVFLHFLIYVNKNTINIHYSNINLDNLKYNITI